MWRVCIPALLPELARAAAREAAHDGFVIAACGTELVQIVRIAALPIVACPALYDFAAHCRSGQARRPPELALAVRKFAHFPPATTLLPKRAQLCFAELIIELIAAVQASDIYSTSALHFRGVITRCLLLA